MKIRSLGGEVLKETGGLGGDKKYGVVKKS